MVTAPSSSGSRSVSRTDGENSASSSRNSAPPCARLTSPGRGGEPPPTSARCEAVWCGARKERLPRSRRSDQQQAVPTGGGDLESALGRLVPGDVPEVDRMRGPCRG